MGAAVKGRRVTILIASGSILPWSVSAAVLFRVPLPPALRDVRGTPFVLGPFAFEVARSLEETTRVVAVSVGGAWVSPSSEDKARPLGMGEALVVWVENDTALEQPIRVEVTGLASDEDEDPPAPGEHLN